MTELTLFDEPAVSTPLNLAELPVEHPYTRYGLAKILVQSRLHLNKMTEEVLREALAQAIETGLGNFRMRTDNNPESGRLLRYRAISLEDLSANPKWVQSKGLAEKGIYIYPTIIATDGNAKDTWKHAITVIKKLRDGVSLQKNLNLSRSFAPTTAKINNGKASQSPPKGTLLEAACSLVTTLTSDKPAVWNLRNTAIIPDLPLDELRDFIALFGKMRSSKVDGDLMQVTLKEGKKKYQRPRLHSGNYPYAPYSSDAFGAVGLLGAIGRWANAVGETPWAERILKSIANNSLYIVSYDDISQVRFTHHVVGLSIRNELSKIVGALWDDTKLYAHIDEPFIAHNTPSYQLFYLHASRFLQSFESYAFADFLAVRAEYPPEIQPLFKEYFKNMDKKIVESAGELGLWLNRTAYFVAEREIPENAADRKSKIRKAKAKILIEFESAAMSAKSPTDMLFRISTRSGRLLQDDAPAGAKRFMDATATGEIDEESAKQLLIAYIRLRAPRKQVVEDAGENTNESADEVMGD